MTIKELITNLQNSIFAGEVKESDEVCYRDHEWGVDEPAEFLNIKPGKVVLNNSEG